MKAVCRMLLVIYALPFAILGFLGTMTYGCILAGMSYAKDYVKWMGIK